ncbi:hypothetical protein Glove_562g48 [Diversispora epigaea]|uniref:Uncharacterized protein n=1 Tax=Diversispora epigaea TaxID=1348612 RepID=A0A397GAR3_9GLOM|nr:hypothetical protein Glove_562g48 [Diversispora epigaea]
MYTHNLTNTEKHELTEETKKFLYERIISIYMRSRQKSWRRFNELTPEKGTSSLRENLKAMKNDIKKIENKPALIKKSNILKNPMFRLEQIRIWAHLENVEDEFSKIFLMNELKWLLWVFGDNSKNKKKERLNTFNFGSFKKGNTFF